LGLVEVALTDFSNTVYLSSKTVIKTKIGTTKKVADWVDFPNKKKKETT